MLPFSIYEQSYMDIRPSQHAELFANLLASAVRYAEFRSRWALTTTDERQEIDHDRTGAHNTFIDSCNALSRAMARSGEDIGWRASLGDDRKVIGDFACYIHLFLTLPAR
jgi:hypothetical protein